MTTLITDMENADDLFDSLMNEYLSQRKKQIAELDASGLKDKDPRSYDIVMKLIENNRPIFCDLTKEDQEVS